MRQGKTSSKEGDKAAECVNKKMRRRPRTTIMGKKSDNVKNIIRGVVCMKANTMTGSDATHE